MERDSGHLTRGNSPCDLTEKATHTQTCLFHLAITWQTREKKTQGRADKSSPVNAGVGQMYLAFLKEPGTTQTPR